MHEDLEALRSVAPWWKRYVERKRFKPVFDKIKREGSGQIYVETGPIRCPPVYEMRSGGWHTKRMPIRSDTYEEG